MSIPVGKVIETSKAINTDWFGADLGRVGHPSDTDSVPLIHTLQIHISTTSVVNVILKNTAGNDTFALNGGVAISAAVGWGGSILLLPGDTYNIQHATGNPQNVNARIVQDVRAAW